LFVFLFISVRMSKNKRYELLDWFLLAVVIFNIIGFALVIWGVHYEEMSLPRSSEILEFDISTTVYFLGLNCILIVTSIFGWYLRTAFKKTYNYKKKRIKNSNIDSLRYNKNINRVAWIMLLFSFVGY